MGKRVSQNCLLQWIAGGLTVVLASMSPSVGLADSSSPKLAAYYDRQMAIVNGATYAWEWDAAPARLDVDAVQVGVGRRTYYALTSRGVLLGIANTGKPSRTLMNNVKGFAAGRTGLLVIDRADTLWWLDDEGVKAKIAEGVKTAAVGDSANYYVTKAGDLFVKGKAHRGQYGDGRLKPTDTFVRTATDVKTINAHTGHAILLKQNGDVLGTGGNIYGPVGVHGLGDKAVRWSKIMSGARAVATGSTHTLAIQHDGSLFAWGNEYGPSPVRILEEIDAVAAGSSATIALTEDGRLLQWARGEEPREVKLD